MSRISRFAAGAVAKLSELTTKKHHELEAWDEFDDHAQYARLEGRAGGQELYGGTLEGQNLYLNGTLVEGSEVNSVIVGLRKGVPTPSRLAVAVEPAEATTHLAGHQASSATSGTGNPSLRVLYVQGPKGGEVTGEAGEVEGGSGSALVFESGAGGECPNSIEKNFGGTAGAVTFVGGGGGKALVGEHCTGGAGGNVTATAGEGGESKFTVSKGSALSLAGQGGSFALAGGAGGIARGTTNRPTTGGEGGSVGIIGGAGGIAEGSTEKLGGAGGLARVAGGKGGGATVAAGIASLDGGEAAATETFEWEGEVTEKSTVIKGLTGTKGIVVGAEVAGTKIKVGTKVTSVVNLSLNEITISNAIEGAGSGTVKEKLKFKSFGQSGVARMRTGLKVGVEVKAGARVSSGTEKVAVGLFGAAPVEQPAAVTKVTKKEGEGGVTEEIITKLNAIIKAVAAGEGGWGGTA